MAALIKKFFHDFHIHPRQWWQGIFSYSHYLGYIKPSLIGVAAEEFTVRRSLLRTAWQPRVLSRISGKRLLVLSPHPDDEAIGAGGLLWAHREISEFHFIVISKGEKGGALQEPITNHDAYQLKTAHTRKEEFLKTVKSLNAKSYHFLDFLDGHIPYSSDAVKQLQNIVEEISPEVVLLPWFLDNCPDHRLTNIIYAWGCKHLECMVLGSEVWTMLEPNAFFDITPYLEAKLALIRNYESQLRTVDYANYALGLARVRAYQYPVSNNRAGAVEAYLALPNKEYCDLVCSIYGEPGIIKKSAYPLLHFEE